MKTAILITILLLGKIASSQTIYSPIEYNADDVGNPNVNLLDYYTWYLNTDINLLSISFPDTDEGKEKLKEQMDLLELDQKNPYRVMKSGKSTYKYYKSPLVYDAFVFNIHLPNKYELVLCVKM
jgi:hypothetical protein